MDIFNRNGEGEIWQLFLISCEFEFVDFGVYTQYIG